MMGSYGSESLFNAPSGGSNKELALALMKADSEKEVINILKKTGYWDDDSAWREYGDNARNYSIIGNQQSSADNALVEKLVNSVDAVLMCECLKQGIDPEGNGAPQNIAEAQRKYFDIREGKMSSIDSKLRSKIAENILLIASGSKSRPCFSIIDKGEGHSPKRMPKTILSLTKNNKIKISFVQGKFGMGGTGVLRFCSHEHSLMLVISKRNHEIDVQTDEEIDPEKLANDETRNLWGVTVVRREDPKGGEKSSHYTYLAPDNKILSFDSDKLPILENAPLNMMREPMESGTYIKLYEYDIGIGLRSLIDFDLYYRLSLLMPDIALPIRMIECRDYRGHSHEKTLAGLSVRLEEDRDENLEPEFRDPSTGTFHVEEQKLGYSIHVFKPGKEKNYAPDEGVAFSVNGQAHGFLPRRFFTKKAVNMDYLDKSILVMVDCSKMDERPQEQLFMPSRDRLSNEAIRKAVESELESIIKNHRGLKDLQHRRWKEKAHDNVQDTKSFEDFFKDMVKESPTFAKYLSLGYRIANPFREDDKAETQFVGKRFPTSFDFIGKNTADSPKNCPINQKRFMVKFRTDAENNYFRRDDEPGELTLELDGEKVYYNSLNLWDGEIVLTVTLPTDIRVGEILCFEANLIDTNQAQPLSCKFYIHVNGPSKIQPPRPEPLPKKSKLDVPKIEEIRKEEWGEYGFDKYSALKVMKNPEEIGGYTFYVNLDNIYLKSEIKNESNIQPTILERRYKHGLALLAMSILKFDDEKSKNDEAGEANTTLASKGNTLSIYEQISDLAKAVSPVLLPMIKLLGSKKATEELAPK